MAPLHLFDPDTYTLVHRPFIVPLGTAKTQLGRSGRTILLLPTTYSQGMRMPQVLETLCRV